MRINPTVRLLISLSSGVGVCQIPLSLSTNGKTLFRRMYNFSLQHSRHIWQPPGWSPRNGVPVNWKVKSVLQIAQHNAKTSDKVHASKVKHAQRNNPNIEKIVINRNEYSMFKMFNMQWIYATKHQKQTTKTRHHVDEQLEAINDKYHKIFRT